MDLKDIVLKPVSEEEFSRYYRVWKKRDPEVDGQGTALIVKSPEWLTYKHLIDDVMTHPYCDRLSYAPGGHWKRLAKHRIKPMEIQKMLAELPYVKGVPKDMEIRFSVPEIGTLDRNFESKIQATDLGDRVVIYRASISQEMVNLFSWPGQPDRGKEYIFAILKNPLPDRR